MCKVFPNLCSHRPRHNNVALSIKTMLTKGLESSHQTLGDSSVNGEMCMCRRRWQRIWRKSWKVGLGEMGDRAGVTPVRNGLETRGQGERIEQKWS